MDVIQLLKKEQTATLKILVEICARSLSPSAYPSQDNALEDFAQLNRCIDRFLSLNKDFFFPELLAQFKGAEKTIDKCLERQQEVWSVLDQINTLRPEGDSEGFCELVILLEKRFRQLADSLTDQLFPKVRQRVDTEQREDIGLIYSDLLADFQPKHSA